MNTVASLETPPRLKTEAFWPVRWRTASTMSYEHQVEADGSDWNHITPHGSIFDEPRQPGSTGETIAWERRATLRHAISRGVTDLWRTERVITKFGKVTHHLEKLEWDDLASSVSGLVHQAQERRQALVAQRVPELTEALSHETASLGVLLSETEGPDKLMGRLGGFFVQAAENDGSGVSQLGITMIGTSGEIGQSPQGYEPYGLYLRAA